MNTQETYEDDDDDERAEAKRVGCEFRRRAIRLRGSLLCEAHTLFEPCGCELESMRSHSFRGSLCCALAGPRRGGIIDDRPTAQRAPPQALHGPRRRVFEPGLGRKVEPGGLFAWVWQIEPSAPQCARARIGMVLEIVVLKRPVMCTGTPPARPALVAPASKRNRSPSSGGPCFDMSASRPHALRLGASGCPRAMRPGRACACCGPPPLESEAEAHASAASSRGGSGRAARAPDV